MGASRRTLLRQFAGLVALPALPRLAWALDYPNRPVHVLNGFAPGGQNDIFARLLGQWVSQRLGRNITLSARPRDNAELEDFMMQEFFADPRRLN